MATLKGTISDSDDEVETKKWDLKWKRKEEDNILEIDNEFKMIDDSFWKDISKLNAKKEYEGTLEGGNKWSYSKTVTEDNS